MNEMKCKRCGANENRIHGFCSMECETAWYYEDDIRDLTARIAELEGLVRELLAEGEYLSMLNGLVDNDSDWKQLVDKANKVLPEVTE